MPRSNPDPPNPIPIGQTQSRTLTPTQANGASLALLSLFDRIDLMAVNPSLGARVLGFRHGLHSALAQLRRREGGMPEVVVLTLEWVYRLELEYADDSAGPKPNPRPNPNPNPGRNPNSNPNPTLTLTLTRLGVRLCRDQLQPLVGARAAGKLAP